MIPRLGLSLLLIGAVILHLFFSALFDPAIPFDFKFKINLALYLGLLRAST